MALDDFMEPEVAVAAAVTALISSSQLRTAVRRGAIFGLAGLLKASSAMSTGAGSLFQDVQRGGADELQDITSRSPAPEARTEPPQ